MLRNLLYSFFFHVMFIGLLFLSTIELDTKIIKTEATPLTINFLNDNVIDDIKEVKTKSEDERVKNLTLDEKIDLYNKIKNQKEIEKSNRIVYEKSKKQPVKKKQPEIKSNTENEENEFSYYYTPVYVAEDKINTEEKRKLIENRLKREELRRKMKEKNIIPKVDVNNIKQMRSMDEIVKVSQKPLVVKKEKKVEKKLEKLENGNNITNNSGVEPDIQEMTLDINELVTEINIANNIIDDKYKGLGKDQIFNENDFKKLKEIDDNKSDTRYMLSLREKRNIQRQIKGCYKMAILRSKKDSKAVVALTVKVEQDGIIDMKSIKVNKIIDNFDKTGFDIALENAKSALVFCSPLRGLPVGKYKSWKQMTFVFDSNNLE